MKCWPEGAKEQRHFAATCVAGSRCVRTVEASANGEVLLTEKGHGDTFDWRVFRLSDMAISSQKFRPQTPTPSSVPKPEPKKEMEKRRRQRIAQLS
jgi:hypothetical protein